MNFVEKEFLHILRDRRTILIILVMPIIQIILFGFALTNEVTNARIGVVDYAKDEITHSIIEEIKSSDIFVIEDLYNSFYEAEHALVNNEISDIIVFENHFEENILHTGSANVQIITDASDPNQALIKNGYLSAIIGNNIKNTFNIQIPVNIETNVKMLYNPQSKSAYNFVPGIMGFILMLICAMMTSIAIVREKEMGTMEVLLASPIRPYNIILAKITPYFVISLFNLTTVLLLARFVLHVPVSSLGTIILVSFIFIIVSLALGLLISSLVSDQVSAMLISGLGLLMPTMLLAGMVFPIESMPKLLQYISSIVPARWFVSAIKKLMIQGVGISAVVREIIIMSAMALALISVCIKKFKIRLE